MARGTILLEFTLVRVGVAGGAGRKGKPEISRLPVRSSSVALLATNVQVLPRERIARFRVVEILLIDPGVLPVGRIVALRAVGPEPALVLVLMTCGALRRQAEIGLAQVLLRLCQKTSRRRWNIFRLMTLAAAYADMLPIQHVAGLGVIESFWSRVPVQEGEVLPVVIGVALDAGLAGLARVRVGAVQATMLI